MQLEYVNSIWFCHDGVRFFFLQRQVHIFLTQSWENFFLMQKFEKIELQNLKDKPPWKNKIMPIHETAANLSNTKKKQSEKFEGCSNFSEWSALSKILLLLFFFIMS